MDRKLVSMQPWETAWLLVKWNITRKELLEIINLLHTRSRRKIEKELKALGYKLRKDLPDTESSDETLERLNKV